MNHICSLLTPEEQSCLSEGFLSVYYKLSQASLAWVPLLSQGDVRRWRRDEGWAPSRQGDQVYNHPGARGSGNYSYRLFFFQDGQLLIRTQGSWVCDLGQVICFWELYLLTFPQSVDEQSLPTSPQGASVSPALPTPTAFLFQRTPGKGSDERRLGARLGPEMEGKLLAQLPGASLVH